MGVKLAGKRVLITGAARGIGLCTAEEFARAGCHLVLTDIRQDALADASAKLGRHGIQVETHVVDVTRQDEVEKMARQVLNRHGGLDILINNAGIGHNAELAKTTIPAWRKLIDVNLLGPLYHVYAFLPSMIERRAGQIVNVSSGQAFYRLPTWGAYAAVKVALGVFSEVLSFELRKYGIRVTTVYPFMVNTAFYEGVRGETFTGRLSMKLLPYYSDTPEEVARIIFRAVRSGKRIEMVSFFNHIGFYSHLVPPAAAVIGLVTSRLLASPAEPKAPAGSKNKAETA
ncbi:MAG: SDR family oxidoreductase [Nitrospirae bacterium]|nr:SDR family oxidoreductase [Nitrospirota bacterium]